MQYGYILRNALTSGDRMVSELSSEQEMNEEKVPLSYLMSGTIVGGIYGAFVLLIALTYTPLLVGAYNYLAGARSSIDQAAIAFLGPDNARLAIMMSCIIWTMCGFALSRVVTTKLDMARTEREAGLGNSYVILLLGWMFLIELMPLSSSRFLADMGLYMTVGWFFGYIIPVLLKYLHLLLHARSINSHIELVGPSRRSGIWRRLGLMRLRVVPNDFEWW